MASGRIAGRVPHLARGADHRGHRRVDDDVAGHVQVGDAAVGVDHRQRGAVGEALLDAGLDGGPPVLRQRLDRLQQVGRDRRWRLMPASARAAPCSAKTCGKNASTACPKMIGSDTFIIVALRWSENSTPLALASAIWAVRNATRAALLMTVASKTSPARSGVDALRTVVVPSAATQLDADVGGLGDGGGPLVRPEVARRPSWTRGSWSRATRRPWSAGSCGRTASPRPGPGGRSCPRAARGSRRCP